MKLEKSHMPKHVAIIMDGNRRWARKRGLAVMRGHQHVADNNLQRLVEHSIKRGIAYVTMWAFSLENWERSKVEVKGLMNLFRQVLAKNIEEMDKKGVRINIIGDLSRFDEDIQQKVKYWVNRTRNNKKLVLTLALNYGGRDEILRAVSKMVAGIVNSKMKLEQLKKKIGQSTKLFSEELLASFLDTAGLPNPDLIIRLGGEKRMSGFMAWQSVYSELYFTDVLAPDFNEAEYDKALVEFTRRQRRFGR